MNRSVGLITFIIFFLLFFIFPLRVLAASFSFPMDRVFERVTDKPFGQYVDEQYYIGREKLYPYNRFYGYHSGVDLEIFPEELDKDIPVLAVASGTIVFAGPVSGYGGLVLERMEGENLTVLYGHIRLSSVSFKVGDRIDGGEQIALLGDAFSNETGRERKHLHFGIYKGMDQYFRGYENTQALLNTKWIDPLPYLEEKVVVGTEPVIPTIVQNLKKPPVVVQPTQKGILDSIAEFWQKLLSVFNFKF